MGNWLSIHIFYSANNNPILVDCVAPLVEMLRERGLLARYFFIRYWLNGPHLRLRLLPSSSAAAEEVKALADAAVREFLARRPSLFDFDRDNVGKVYREMYIAEYGAEDFEAKYGKDGEIPFYDNNSFHHIAYEQEVARYAGPHGMELSERHFEASSEVVIKLVQTTNVHLGSITLGGGVQLMLRLCYGLLDGDAEVADFLEKYRAFWQDSYGAGSVGLYPRFDRKYERLASRLAQRIADVRQQVAAGDASQGTEAERYWARHVRQLRREIKELAEARLLELPGGMEGDEMARRYLLSSYVHMTNNRMGVSILDEIYLSYLINRALGRGDAGTAKEVAVA